MTLSRRNLLTASALAIPVTVLAGCASTNTPVQNTQQIVLDLQNAVPALKNSLAAIPAGTIPAATLATINASLASAQSVLAGLSSSMTATQAAPLVQQIESDLNAVISAAAAVPLIPPPFSVALAAAAVILPIVEGFVNSTLHLGAVAAAFPARTKVIGMAPPMTVAQAQATLAAMAK